MKAMKWALGIVLAGALAARADNLAIQSFETGGKLTFNEVANASGYRVDWSSNICASAWSSNAPGIGAVPATGSGSLTVTVGVDRAVCFYRVVAAVTSAPPPIDMVLIPAGSFVMGNATNLFPDDGSSLETPQHTVYVSSFYMDSREVTKALWDDVYNWATNNGYGFDCAGSGKSANHPVQTVCWWDAVKWCNARSQKEGRTPAYYTTAAQADAYKTGQTNLPNDCVKWTGGGYRLPTEAEWEKAARGHTAGTRFPWTDYTNKISHARANYWGRPVNWPYDLSSGYPPAYNNGVQPYTSPVGDFPPNGYGLYDMAGNVCEWCWDWFDGSYYASSSGADPRGPAVSPDAKRAARGGGWSDQAPSCRAAYRGNFSPNYANIKTGFRAVLPVAP